MLIIDEITGHSFLIGACDKIAQICLRPYYHYTRLKEPYRALWTLFFAVETDDTKIAFEAKTQGLGVRRLGIRRLRTKRLDPRRLGTT